MEQCLRKGERRVISILPQLRVREIAAAEVARFDPGFDSFSNINTPQEYYDLRNGDKARPVPDRVEPEAMEIKAQA